MSAPRRVPPLVRLARAARVVHPFPSVLDGVVVAAVALVGGGAPDLAARLGVSMTLLQFAIGALNDVVDAPTDAGRKPGKPIPAGFVPHRLAAAVALTSAVAGVGLALAAGPLLGALAIVVLGIGASYDLRAKGTPLSWLPLAVGIPILPVYGWLGATGSLPSVFGVLVPLAAVAGAALAIANALVDLERDLAAGAGSVAVALGPGRAARIVLLLHAIVGMAALVVSGAVGAPAGWLAAIALAATVPAGGAGIGIAASGRPATGLRERAWEVQAVGTALLAVAWLGAVSAAGAMGR